MIEISYHYVLKYLAKIGRAIATDIPKEPCENHDIKFISDITCGFKLNSSEQTLLLLSAVNQTNEEFNQIFSELGGFNLLLVRDVFEANFEEKFEIRLDFLKKFLFEEQNLRLKAYVVSFILGFEVCEKYKLYDEKHENFEKLKNLDGKFSFIGDYGSGRKKCFLALCSSKKYAPFFVSSEENASENAFRAVVFSGGLCITECRLLSCISEYLPYIKFAVLISEHDFEQDGFFSVKFCKLSFVERTNLWKKGGLSEKLINFASNYDFSPKEIEKILENAEIYRNILKEDTISMQNITEIIHRKLKGKGQSLYQEKSINFELSKVILPKKQKNKLKEAIVQVKNRQKVLETYKISETIQYGTGLSILLVGPPGTGKTMTAYALANELRALMYKIDLSMIVSKFVGETEKNLKKIFEEAKNTQAMLFFDEADALFSKRTDVQNSNDKYSNMEAAFLLQEIENFEGTTILATNFLQNIDEGFKRRMKFIIEFPYPSASERVQIFNESISSGLNLASDVDFEFIAENFELTGANIKNIIYNAAFLATENSDVLDMKCLILSVISEYEKMGKHLSFKDFGVYQELFGV